MKLGLSLLISLLLISTAAFGALSVDDFEKIREIVKESEDRLRAENAASEARTSKQLDRNLTLFVALFGFIAVIIGIPLTLVMLQTRKERDRDKQHNAQQQQIQTQQQQLHEQQQVIAALQQQLEGMNHELETLKQHSMFR